MTTWLSLALVAEGPSDYAFLAPLLRRVAIELMSAHCPRDFAIPDNVICIDPSQRNNESIFHELLDRTGEYAVVAFHKDSDGADLYRVLRDEIDARFVAHAPDLQGKYVGVVPVRETEAWVLADKSALLGALGITQGVLTYPDDVEQIRDPKAVLDSFIRSLNVRRGQGFVSDYFPIIGERVSLRRLLGVNSFSEFHDRFSEVLNQLGMFR